MGYVFTYFAFQVFKMLMYQSSTLSLSPVSVSLVNICKLKYLSVMLYIVKEYKAITDEMNNTDFFANSNILLLCRKCPANTQVGYTVHVQYMSYMSPFSNRAHSFGVPFQNFLFDCTCNITL